MKSNLVSALLSVLLLAGCASSSVKELRESATPENRASAEVSVNYQIVHKRIMDKLSECMGEAQVGLFANMHIKSEVFSELRETRLSYMMTNLGSQRYYFHANIIGTDTNKTRIDGFVSFDSWRPILPKLREWAMDENAPCGAAPKPAAAN